MEPLQFEKVPNLRNPVLIAAFGGWNDAAEAATSAVHLLKESWDATRFATIDPEEFYDFTESRPHIRIVDGGDRALEWPANEFYYHADPTLPQDIVLFLGVEPNLRWRAFTGLITEAARRAGATLLVTLGALLADTPHTRPVRVTGFASDPSLAARVNRSNVRRSRYEGPTGIVGVLHDAARRAGFTTASLWANVPHYISASPNPRATAALLARLDGILDLRLDLSALEQQGQEFDAQIAEVVAGNPDVAAYVRSLEQREDEGGEEAVTERHDLPSGESVVRELEEFLRRQREDEDHGPEDESADGGEGRPPA